MLRCYQFFLYICVSLFSRNLIYSLLCKFLLEKNQKRKSTQWFIIKNSKRFVIKVAPRVEKTEVFRKGWNFANQIYFASCKMRKHFFLLWTKEILFFSYFYHGIIFYSAELFDSAVNFKHKHKSNIKGAMFEFRSSHLFQGQSYKEVGVKCPACNFTGVLSFTSVFEDLGHIFPTYFLQNLL